MELPLQCIHTGQQKPNLSGDSVPFIAFKSTLVTVLYIYICGATFNKLFVGPTTDKRVSVKLEEYSVLLTSVHFPEVFPRSRRVG
jgi:hypothetical protein